MLSLLYACTLHKPLPYDVNHTLYFKLLRPASTHSFIKDASQVAGLVGQKRSWLQYYRVGPKLENLPCSNTSVGNILPWKKKRIIMNVHKIRITLQTGLRLFWPMWPHQCSADTGADTWKKRALYHMSGWLTLAEQVQTHYHARVLKNTCKQVTGFAQRLKSIMATPLNSAQQLHNQTDQVWGQVKPDWSYQNQNHVILKN